MDIDQLVKKNEQLKKDRSELMEALRVLRNKMKELNEDLTGVFTMFAVHGGKWPEDKNWKAEADAADALLARLEPK